MPSSQYDEFPGHGGRRRAKRRSVAAPILAALVVLGLLAGGGWYLTRDGKDAVATGQDEPLTAGTGPSSTSPSDEPAELPTPTATPSVTPTPTPTPTLTPSRTPSATPSRTPPNKPSATPTPTRSSSAPSRGSTRTPTPSPKPTRTSTPRPTTTKPAPPSGGSAETQVLHLTNAERQKAGCGPLRSNAALTRAAEGHAADMVDRHYFDHTSLDGRSPFDRMKAAGFTGGAMAENIAVGYSSPAAVVEGWMKSTGHRKNMLNCSYTMIGIGYHSGQVKPDWGNGSWVQNFGG
ncbi:SCP-like extracellular [Kribbella flavida DSM 17836]|uniref:SCP-like extracellular n=1 Tax=Kribbella flavida (strain DSM 17836 / JCM 10339 / NBRC 14399) TaxID=479435 RepID=D2Q485_KRIFD|nr:CAP domain-containing protein [Kribbella flavida]ADB30399.1 SCP-like extracellular [Kribbella flavida DSM 17836]